MNFQTCERCPIMGRYYFVNDLYEVQTSNDIRLPEDNKRFKVGNYFHTKPLAESYADMLKTERIIQLCLDECKTGLKVSQLVLMTDQLAYVVNCEDGYSFKFLSSLCMQIILQHIDLDTLILYFGGD